MRPGDAGAEAAPRWRLLVCVNPVSGPNKPCCGGDRRSERLARALEAGIAARRIACEVARIHCLNKCLQGPAMRLAPGGAFFLGVEEEGLPDLLDRLEAACGRRAADPDGEAGDPFGGLYPGA